MKTISGTVYSSKPISLGRATSTLSNFVSSNNGASQAMSAYLRRTLASFKELKHLYKDLHHSGNKRKRSSSAATAAASHSEPHRKRHKP